jgi:hypothetical protein
MRIVLTILCLACVVSAGNGQVLSTASTQEWKLVRSVSNEQGGTMDFVVVPEQRRFDRPYYEEISNAICGPRGNCMVHFWSDERHVPTSAWMSGTALTEMTAQYERSLTYDAPVLRLACWLYATKAEAESAGCFYLPGARVSWPR